MPRPGNAEPLAQRLELQSQIERQIGEREVVIERTAQRGKALGYILDKGFTVGEVGLQPIATGQIGKCPGHHLRFTY